MKIKFRGKRIDNGEFVYGNLEIIQEYKDLPPKYYILQPNGFKLMTSKKLYWLKEKQLKQDYISYEVVPETVGQYMGFQDRKGKDIYDGDILQVKESLSNFIYDYSNRSFSSHSWENNFKHVAKFSPSGWQLISYFVNQHECEVVGDIYTNPELLTT